jgi:hypothetical protein
MKQHSMLGRRFGTVTFVVALITACANGDSNIDDTSDGGTTKKDATTYKDTGNGGQDTGSNMCMSCNIDLDCQNTCGTPPNGMTWCCDTGMNSCYPAQACQDQDAGGGTD